MFQSPWKASSKSSYILDFPNKEMVILIFKNPRCFSNSSEMITLPARRHDYFVCLDNNYVSAMKMIHGNDDFVKI